MNMTTIKLIRLIIAATLKAVGQHNVTDCKIGVLPNTPGDLQLVFERPGSTVTAHIVGDQITYTTKAG